MTQQTNTANRQKNSSVRGGTFSFVAQIDSSDCAAACLSMVAQYYGIDLLLSEARNFCGANASGQDISESAEKLGLKANLRRLKFNNILESNYPLVAHWQGNHWVVILAVKAGNVKIADPAAGVYWLSTQEATLAYSGYICQFEGQSRISPLRSRNNWLLPCLAPFKKVIFPAALLILMAVAGEVLIPYILQELIDERLFDDEAVFKWLVFYAALAGSAVFVGQGLQSWLLSKAASKSESMLLEQLFERWLTMPEAFFRDRSFRELRVRFESVFKIKVFLQESAGIILFSLLELIAIFALLEHYGKAVLFAFLWLPALGLVVLTFVLSRRQAGALKLSQESFLNCLDDMTKGMFSIRNSCAETFFKTIEKEAKEKMQLMVNKNQRDMILCDRGALAIGLSSTLFLFYRSGMDYMSGEGSAGTMIAVLLLSALALNTLYRILGQRENFEDGAVVYDYLHDVFDSPIYVNDGVEDEHPAEVKWEGCDVNQRRGSLKSFSLRLPAKDSLFLAGESQLVLETLKKNISLDKGELTLTTAQQSYSSKDHLPLLSFMEEYPHVFNISAYENVAMNQKVDKKRVRWCLRLALCDHLEKHLQYGLDTKIVEENLSYEDKMKLVLARTLYRRAPVYILENISSFLSPKELLVFGYHLKNHMQDQTVIVSDSDLTLAKYCSQVAIVYNGKLREQGTVADLEKANGMYSMMIEG
jgi:ATP-binding cassette subfamily B protein